MLCIFGVFFFFKQKTAYEMRISDWSSDVCSSDLSRARVNRSGLLRYARNDQLWIGRPYEIKPVGRGIQSQRIAVGGIKRRLQIARRPFEIGRASCRERVCQYV